MTKSNRIEQFQVIKNGLSTEIYALDSNGLLWVTINSSYMPELSNWRLVKTPSLVEQAGAADHE